MYYLLYNGENTLFIQVCINNKSLTVERLLFSEFLTLLKAYYPLSDILACLKAEIAYTPEIVAITTLTQ